ncbi:TPA: hypothetical protein ACHDW5_001905 [Campylobacter jejuni]|uniref:hypothetical protein n=1 Tax=Campylobacter jejuni TaxID=197 RepID=UPI0008758A62|nr:hypothetical protein [Campylobacter jejuni]ECP9345084.1 hypothetical protein [Campylobacter jejuni]ECP9346828.1 hypothetical protein [Campylobacter jejuni]OEW88267.1 hypothetical protein A0M29_08155 [Campylobacter jejuni]RTJ11094.1 hypothetical protein C3H91_02910 [Campylobacter jejuni]RTJ52587.1 hypothetical protein C3H69_01955 [Campylobacter jejuni]
MKKSQNKSNITLNQQNNTFINVNSSFDCLPKLSKEMQEKCISLMEKQTDHIINIEKKLIEEDSKNQEAIRNLAPQQIKYVKKGQLFAFIIVVIGFIFSAFLAYLDYPWLSLAGIVTSIGVISSQFLGQKRDKNQGL